MSSVFCHKISISHSSSYLISLLHYYKYGALVVHINFFLSFHSCLASPFTTMLRIHMISLYMMFKSLLQNSQYKVFPKKYIVFIYALKDYIFFTLLIFVVILLCNSSFCQFLSFCYANILQL